MIIPSTMIITLFKLINNDTCGDYVLSFHPLYRNGVESAQHSPIMAQCNPGKSCFREIKTKIGSNALKNKGTWVYKRRIKHLITMVKKLAQ